MKKLATLFIFLFLLGELTHAQYVSTPPVQDGTVTSSEYSNNNSGNWYMTWDADSLYFAKIGGVTTEPVLMYFQINPISPVDGGTNSDGDLTGKLDYSNTPNLPFRANVRIYISQNYIEYTLSNGSGGWGSAQTGNMTSITSSTNREVAIAWNAINNNSGIPTSFNWLGFEMSTANPDYVYDQVPSSNYSGNSTTTPTFNYYFTVSSTVNNASTNPFGQTSYELRGTTGTVGTSPIFDASLSNGADFGTSTTLNGTLTIESGGYASNSHSPAYGANSTLCYDNGGTYTTSYEWPSSNSPHNVTIKNGSTITLGGSETIAGTLTLTSGTITLGADNLTIQSPGTISGASSSNYIITNSTGSLIQYLMNTGSNPVTYPIGPSSTSYNPVIINLDASGISGNFNASVATSTANVSDATGVVNKQWTITHTGLSGSIILQWNAADEGGTFSPSGAQIENYTGSGTDWTALTTSPVSGSGPYTASGTIAGSGTVYTIGNPSALPVELTTFTASLNNSAVELSWKTATEVNNYGFEIQRLNNSHSSSVNGQWEKIGFVKGAGSSSSPKQYSFTDKSVSFGSYSYRLKQIDVDGQYKYSSVVNVNAGQLPNGFVLNQNYPNPFNPTTQIQFGFNDNTRASLTVYNVLGQKVANLFDGLAQGGQLYNVTFNGDRFASGIYYYKLQSDNHVEIKKMLLMK